MSSRRRSSRAGSTSTTCSARETDRRQQSRSPLLNSSGIRRRSTPFGRDAGRGTLGAPASTACRRATSPTPSGGGPIRRGPAASTRPGSPRRRPPRPARAACPPDEGPGGVVRGQCGIPAVEHADRGHDIAALGTGAIDEVVAQETRVLSQRRDELPLDPAADLVDRADAVIVPDADEHGRPPPLGCRAAGRSRRKGRGTLPETLGTVAAMSAGRAVAVGARARRGQAGEDASRRADLVVLRWTRRVYDARTRGIGGRRHVWCASAVSYRPDELVTDRSGA